VRPAAVIGAATHTSMIVFVAFGVYAAVRAQRGKPLRFGGDWMGWRYGMAHTSARLTGYLSEWAVLEGGCEIQALNAQDGGLLSFERFFGEVARWRGGLVGGWVVGPVEGEEYYEAL
jgi:hypothetical protein